LLIVKNKKCSRYFSKEKKSKIKKTILFEIINTSNLFYSPGIRSPASDLWLASSSSSYRERARLVTLTEALLVELVCSKLKHQSKMD
jgi:hypothetical protein